MGIGAITVISAVFALWWDLGSAHSFHNSDDLVPIMASLWRWTPFYWGEDRFGMPLGLLASPLKNPLANLLVQNWLSSFLGFLGLALLPACAWRRAGSIAGLLGAGIFLLLSPAWAVRAWMGTGQCYGTAMGFGIAGLALLATGEKSGMARTALAVFLVFLSIWTNTAMGLVLLPLSLWNARRSRREGKAASGPLIIALAVFSSFALVWFAMRPLGVQRAYTIIPPSGWPEAWSTLAGTSWAGLFKWKMAVLLAGAPLAGLASAAFFPAARKPFFAGLALLATGIVYFAVIATIGWVADRAGDPRYVLPVLALLTASAGVFVSASLASGKPASITAILILGVGTMMQAGLPAPSQIRPALDRSIGAATPDMIRMGVTHLAGEYSRVWPAVFHANMVLHRQEPGRIVWALTFRSTPARPLWKNTDPRTWRIAVLHGDQELTPFSTELKGARKTAQTPVITVFQPAVR